MYFNPSVSTALLKPSKFVKSVNYFLFISMHVIKHKLRALKMCIYKAAFKKKHFELGRETMQLQTDLTVLFSTG